MRISGLNETVEVGDGILTITRRGLARINKASGQTLAISSICAVEFGRASVWKNGFIRFLRTGDQGGGGVLAASKENNSVVFRKSQQQPFEQLRTAIERVLSDQATVTTRQSAVPAYSMPIVSTPVAVPPSRRQYSAGVILLVGVVLSASWLYGRSDVPPPTKGRSATAAAPASASSVASSPPVSCKEEMKSFARQVGASLLDDGAANVYILLREDVRGIQFDCSDPQVWISITEKAGQPDRDYLKAVADLGAAFTNRSREAVAEIAATCLLVADRLGRRATGVPFGVYTVGCGGRPQSGMRSIGFTRTLDLR